VFLKEKVSKREDDGRERQKSKQLFCLYWNIHILSLYPGKCLILDIDRKTIYVKLQTGNKFIFFTFIKCIFLTQRPG
jgi:hypothetical protein